MTPTNCNESEPCAATGSASDLLEQWKKAIKERDESVLQRTGHMFYGPMGIEEHVRLLQADAQMNVWFLNKLLVIVAEIEAKMPNA